MAGRILVLGYGNVDRQDDGVAWHIINHIAVQFGLPAPDPTGEGVPSLADPESLTEGVSDSSIGFPEKLQIDLAFALQLSPEMAESLVHYDLVCFVDAHTGSIPQDVNFVALQGVYQASPFTHHLTPQTCLALAQALYGHSPKGYLLSVRGYEFGFSRELSDQTKQHALHASQQITAWLTRFEVGDNLPSP
jgi:Ni,Fe-hydrogenase maturation factor